MSNITDEAAAIIGTLGRRATCICAACLAIECSIPASRVEDAIKHISGFIAVHRHYRRCTECHCISDVFSINEDLSR
jgi:hypothetical protein